MFKAIRQQFLSAVRPIQQPQPAPRVNRLINFNPSTGRPQQSRVTPDLQTDMQRLPAERVMMNRVR